MTVDFVYTVKLGFHSAIIEKVQVIVLENF